MSRPETNTTFISKLTTEKNKKKKKRRKHPSAGKRSILSCSLLSARRIFKLAGQFPRLHKTRATGAGIVAESAIRATERERGRNRKKKRETGQKGQKVRLAHSTISERGEEAPKTIGRNSSDVQRGSVWTSSLLSVNSLTASRGKS